ELCVVGRYRPRRHADLRDSAPVPAGMADRGKPRGGGHDYFCGYVCGYVPYLSHGTGMGRLLCDALSEHPRTFVAELQLRTFVGRICDLHLLYSFAAFLVLRSCTRLCDHS